MRITTRVNFRNKIPESITVVPGDCSILDPILVNINTPNFQNEVLHDQHLLALGEALLKWDLEADTICGDISEDDLFGEFLMNPEITLLYDEVQYLLKGELPW